MLGCHETGSVLPKLLELLLLTIAGQVTERPSDGCRNTSKSDNGNIMYLVVFYNQVYSLGSGGGGSVRERGRVSMENGLWTEFTKVVFVLMVTIGRRSSSHSSSASMFVLSIVSRSRFFFSLYLL